MPRWRGALVGCNQKTCAPDAPNMLHNVTYEPSTVFSNMRRPRTIGVDRYIHNDIPFMDCLGQKTETYGWLLGILDQLAKAVGLHNVTYEPSAGLFQHAKTKDNRC